MVFIKLPNEIKPADTFCIVRKCENCGKVDTVEIFTRKCSCPICESNNISKPYWAQVK